MKKHSIVFACAFVALLVVGLVALTTVQMKANVYIFADMKECESILSAGGSFSEYADVSSDENVRELTYTDFFAGEYNCDDFEFKIFAYEFDRVDSARAYFDEITGKNSDDLDANFMLSSGLLNSWLAVFDSNRAYVIYAPTKDISNISLLLSEVFSVKIK